MRPYLEDQTIQWPIMREDPYLEDQTIQWPIIRGLTLKIKQYNGNGQLP